MRFNNKLSSWIEMRACLGCLKVIFQQSYELFIALQSKGTYYVILLAGWVTKEDLGYPLIFLKRLSNGGNYLINGCALFSFTAPPPSRFGASGSGDFAR